MRKNPVNKRKRPNVNSSAERAKRGKKPYRAPTQKKHSFVLARDEFLQQRYGKSK